jgi:hypothetical protein
MRRTRPPATARLATSRAPWRFSPGVPPTPRPRCGPRMIRRARRRQAGRFLVVGRSMRCGSCLEHRDRAGSHRVGRAPRQSRQRDASETRRERRRRAGPHSGAPGPPRSRRAMSASCATRQERGRQVGAGGGAAGVRGRWSCVGDPDQWLAGASARASGEAGLVGSAEWLPPPASSRRCPSNPRAAARSRRPGDGAWRAPLRTGPVDRKRSVRASIRRSGACGQRRGAAHTRHIAALSIKPASGRAVSWPW